MVAAVVVTGGHPAAHAPAQADMVPLSASKAYRVKPCPSVTMLPSEVCRTVSAAPPTAGEPAAAGLDAAGPYGPPLLPDEPHAANSTTAAAAGSARRIRGWRPSAASRAAEMV